MKVMEAVAEVIASNVAGFTMGQNLFVHAMPAAAEQGALIKTLLGFNIDGETYMRSGRFQITLRGYDMQTGTALAGQIVEKLRLREHVSPTYGVFIQSCRALHDPLVFQSSVGNTVEISINFLAVFCVL